MTIIFPSVETTGGRKPEILQMSAVSIYGDKFNSYVMPNAKSHYGEHKNYKSELLLLLLDPLEPPKIDEFWGIGISGLGKLGAGKLLVLGPLALEFEEAAEAEEPGPRN